MYVQYMKTGETCMSTHFFHRIIGLGWGGGGGSICGSMKHGNIGGWGDRMPLMGRVIYVCIDFSSQILGPQFPT